MEVRARARACVAHSFRGEAFGEAQNLHGITFVLEAHFKACGSRLTSRVAAELLQNAAGHYHATNLDLAPEFAGENTTCERFARAVWERLRDALDARELDPCAELLVRVRESDVAHVEYERALTAPASMGYYRVSVRSRCMVARTTKPHTSVGGSTLIVDALLGGRTLEEPANFLVDICLAERLLSEAVASLHQLNLDESPAFLPPEPPPTAEAIGAYVWKRVSSALYEEGVGAIDSLRIVVGESDVALAEYELDRSATGSSPQLVLQSVWRHHRRHGPAVVAHARFSGHTMMDRLPSSGCLVSRDEADAWLALAMEGLDEAIDREELFCSDGRGDGTPWCERAAVMIWKRLAEAIPEASASNLSRIEVLINESDQEALLLSRLLHPVPAAGGETIVIDASDLEAALAEGGGADGPTGIAHALPLLSLLAVCGRRVALLAPSALVARRAHLIERTGGLPSWTPEQLQGTRVRRVRPGPGQPLDVALLAALDCVSGQPRDATAYLAAKQEIDEAALNSGVRATLVRHLDQGRRDRAVHLLHVYDLGAGALSMLPRVLRMAVEAGFDAIHYVAIESDAALLAGHAIETTLLAQGYRRTASGQANESTYAREPDESSPIRVDLVLCCEDVFAFVEKEAAGRNLVAPTAVCVELIVASAFADLFHPDAVLSLLVHLVPGALVYLPIVFAGSTRVEPSADCKGSNLPGDKRVVDAYHEHLIAQGQFIDPDAFERAVFAANATMLASGDSSWRIRPDAPFCTYMLDFLTSGAAARLWRGGWSPSCWRRSVIQRDAHICVSNNDYALKLPPAQFRRIHSYPWVEFCAPRVVQVREAQVEPSSALAMLPSATAELRGLVSMISAGTELLVYRGELDGEGQLDSSIEGLADQGMAYPLAYGYSLVGTVSAVGTGAPLNLVGRTAFAFAPHAAAAVVDAESLQLVPHDVSPRDAAYLASAETAISIVHDVHPRAGEAVGVLGVGIIGLLVVAQLAHMGLDVVAIDPDEGRRRIAQAMGASAAHARAEDVQQPSELFDVSVECSGSPLALQSAIDLTRDYGKVVIASWYGKKQATLQLGTRFHRSHLRLVSSQVSSIPGPTSDTWSKQRRFGAAWSLIRRVGPAEAFGTVAYPVERAAEAFEALDKRLHLACQLVYS